MERRVRTVGGPARRLPGPIIYWMSRDQRARDNWALSFAQRMATAHKVPLGVVFCVTPTFLGATWRQYDFMLKGLRETARLLEEKGIPFFLLSGEAPKVLPRYIKRENVGALVTDFDPLRVKRQWKEAVRESVSIPIFEVDTHNIVPCWAASDKQEFAARTIRPKIMRCLPEFLSRLPPLKGQRQPWRRPHETLDWDAFSRRLRFDRSVKPVTWLEPGEEAARRVLRHFIRNGLRHYDNRRNDPNKSGQSDLSPYLHFGQLSPQRVALEVTGADLPGEAKEAFLEELVVRRELSDNFCFYNERYDSVDGFPAWARRTLDRHRKDPREHVYSRRELEKGATHDSLWNAAQTEMMERGKMHGYLRMYWAKKILEWSGSPEDALRTAIYLNDRYELDGRDPNGYSGIAWSIGGVHDRPWSDRPIFGMVRYMSAAGCRRKFDVDGYVARYSRKTDDTMRP